MSTLPAQRHLPWNAGRAFRRLSVVTILAAVSALAQPAEPGAAAAPVEQADPYRPVPLPRPAAESPSTAARASDDVLYRELGGREGIQAIAADYVQRVMVHPLLRSFFEKTDPVNLRDRLTEQICVISGGPCEYTGARMKNVHADFQIHMSDFNAVVEALQQTMDAQHVPFATQNRLLARLAPMHRDIVNTP